MNMPTSGKPACSIMCRLPYCSESMPHRPPIPQIAVTRTWLSDQLVPPVGWHWRFGEPPFLTRSSWT